MFWGLHLSYLQTCAYEIQYIIEFHSSFRFFSLFKAFKQHPSRSHPTFQPPNGRGDPELNLPDACGRSIGSWERLRPVDLTSMPGIQSGDFNKHHHLEKKKSEILFETFTSSFNCKCAFFFVCLCVSFSVGGTVQLWKESTGHTDTWSFLKSKQKLYAWMLALKWN